MLVEDKPQGERFRYDMSTGEATQFGGAYATMRGGATSGRGMLSILLDAQISIAIAGNAEGSGNDVSAFAQSIAEYFLENPPEQLSE